MTVSVLNFRFPGDHAKTMQTCVLRQYYACERGEGEGRRERTGEREEERERVRVRGRVAGGGKVA